MGFITFCKKLIVRSDGLATENEITTEPRVVKEPVIEKFRSSLTPDGRRKIRVSMERERNSKGQFIRRI
jgi:hypothetical protein